MLRQASGRVLNRLCARSVERHTAAALANSHAPGQLPEGDPQGYDAPAVTCTSGLARFGLGPDGGHAPHMHMRMGAHTDAAAREESSSGDAGASATDSRGGDEDGLRDAILEAALTHVATLGWSEDALGAATKQLGLSPAAAGMLEHGAADLVFFFIEKCNLELMTRLEERAEELAGMPVRERVKTAVRLRLEMNVPHINSWPQALALAAHPEVVGKSVQLMGEMVDGVWHAAGDTSTDYNWYTKRMLLAGVYTATELFMLTDYSPNYEETWAALDRRVDDLVHLGKTWGQTVGHFSAVLSGLASKMPPGSRP